MYCTYTVHMKYIIQESGRIQTFLVGSEFGFGRLGTEQVQDPDLRLLKFTYFLLFCCAGKFYGLGSGSWCSQFEKSDPDPDKNRPYPVVDSFTKIM
jgi:hypothetical protein